MKTVKTSRYISLGKLKLALTCGRLDDHSFDGRRNNPAGTCARWPRFDRTLVTYNGEHTRVVAFMFLWWFIGVCWCIPGRRLQWKDRFWLRKTEHGAALEDAYQQGYDAGDQAYPRDRNPYEKGTALREWWDAGWSRSLDELCGT